MPNIANQLSKEQLSSMHNRLIGILQNNFGSKFEYVLATARAIIRADYNTLNINDIECNLGHIIVNDIIRITIDPSATSKKIYYQVINNIFAANKLQSAIKSTRLISKEDKLLALVHINYIIQHIPYESSEARINKYLALLFEVQREGFFSNSKEINRCKTIIKAIQKTTDKVTPEDYLVYD